jgi:hypothetical protein
MNRCCLNNLTVERIIGEKGAMRDVDIAAAPADDEGLSPFHLHYSRERHIGGCTFVDACRRLLRVNLAPKAFYRYFHFGSELNGGSAGNPGLRVASSR